MGRLNQTQTICKGDNIRNKEEILKMNIGVRQENSHGRTTTIHHYLRKRQLKDRLRVKITLFALLA